VHAREPEMPAVAHEAVEGLTPEVGAATGYHMRLPFCSCQHGGSFSQSISAVRLIACSTAPGITSRPGVLGRSGRDALPDGLPDLADKSEQTPSVASATSAGDPREGAWGQNMLEHENAKHALTEFSEEMRRMIAEVKRSRLRTADGRHPCAGRPPRR
jgi:hypothetical protein